MEKYIDVEKLTGRDNYHTWKFGVEHAMKLQGYWKAVEGTEEKEEIIEKATSRLVLYISSNLYVHMQGINTAKEIWNKLKSTYDDSGLTRRCGLLRKLTNTQLVHCKDISEYVDTIIDISQKLNQIGFTVDDEWVGSLLLSGLPEHFAPMIMAIESSNIKITADTIKTKLLQDYDSYNSLGAGSQPELAMYTKQKAKRSVGTKSKKFSCYNCGKDGHIARNCRENKKKNSSPSSNQQTLAASFAAQFDESDNSWIIDSGATTHMAKNRYDFIDFYPSTSDEYVVVANNNRLKVVGRGDISLNVKGNKFVEKIIVKDVLFVPDVCTNLLSVCQMTKKGCEVRFLENKCIILRNKKVLACCNLQNNMFKLCVDTEQKIYAVESKELWHKRMGHAADVSIQELCQKEVLNADLNAKPSNKCIPCLQGVEL